MKELSGTHCLDRNVSNTEGCAIQDAMYIDAIKTTGAMLSRLVRGYEKDTSRRQDLMQDIHVALWKSFESFDARCSVQTWVYRVAHNVAIRHMMNNKRIRLNELHALEEMPEAIAQDEHLAQADDEHLRRLFSLIEQLKPLDRQVILLYLEGQDALSIGEIAGLSSENVATKIHRIKKLLHVMFRERGLL